MTDELQRVDECSAFRDAWKEAHREGDYGNRVWRGLEAVDKIRAGAFLVATVFEGRGKVLLLKSDVVSAEDKIIGCAVRTRTSSFLIREDAEWVLEQIKGVRHGE